ncbi:MAG: Clp1/GlmU family protein [Candidatus Bathyarchaeota archaeon]|nr:Clp1/GlmU family protein [Candidatus Bathyarchaeota archaeon]
MNVTVEKDRTLLVDGPASVALASGKAEVFGAQFKASTQIKNAARIVIREGKRLPFAVQEKAEFVLSLGVGAGVEEVEGNTIPQSWVSAYENLREIHKKPAVALVVGRSGTGKTSFCTYLANKLTAQKYTVAVLDEDLGQSDIGAPCTVAYAYAAKPVTDLFRLKPANSAFVGANSPRSAVDRTIKGTKHLKTEIFADQQADFLIVNTDGWTDTAEAVEFKAHLAEAVDADEVFCMESGEMPSFCAALGDALAGFRQERVEYAVAVKERDPEKRRKLRELGYAKYFEGARVKVYTLSHLTVEGEESGELIRQRQAEDLLVGLYGEGREFLGIGVIRSVNYERRALKVFTSVQKKPAVVSFGKVRLDGNLRELPQRIIREEVID